MRYVLDTNAVSALMRGDAAVLDRLRAVSREDVSVPQPVLAEIAYGIERLISSRRKTRLRLRFAWIRDELPGCVWSDAVSNAFGAVKADLERRGTRLEDFDLAIASHALAQGAVLVTANIGQMTRIAGLEVEDWTTASAS